MADIVFGLLTT